MFSPSVARVLILAGLTPDRALSAVLTIISLLLTSGGIVLSLLIPRAQRRHQALSIVRQAVRDFYPVAVAARWQYRADAEKWRPFADRFEKAYGEYLGAFRPQEKAALSALTSEFVVQLPALVAAAEYARQQLQTAPPPDKPNALYESLAGVSADPRMHAFRAAASKSGHAIYPLLLKTALAFDDTLWMHDEDMSIALGHKPYISKS